MEGRLTFFTFSSPPRFYALTGQLIPWLWAVCLALSVAGLASDRLSLGFVVETERQVEAHLDGHLSKLPASDQRSRAIVVQMKQDEARHAEQAMAAGGADLPTPVKHLMRVAANLMRAVAYRI